MHVKRFALTLTALSSGALLATEPPAQDLQPIIEAHRTFLADDLLEGRAAGTRGFDIAARYVAAQFQRLGLRSMGEGEAYFQTVPLLSAQVNLEASRLVVHGADGAEVALEALNDMTARPAYDSTSETVRAPAVFIGFGVRAGEFGHDDLEGVDLTGKIAVVLAGAPEHLPVTARAHFSRRKYDAIEAAGAIGMVYLNKPDDAQRTPWAVSLARQRFARMRLIDPDGGVVDGLSGIRVSATVRSGGGAALFEGAPMSLDEAHTAAERGEVMHFPLACEVTLHGEATFERTSSSNVLGLLPGSDPALADRPIVITSHLDHLGIGPEIDGDNIYNGAYDNATGTAIMLAAAEALVNGPQRARPVLFAAVTAEEKGLLGSLHLARNPPAGLSGYAANLNVDMTQLHVPNREVLGRGDQHSTLGAIFSEVAAAQGWTVVEDPIPEEVIFVRSDQYSFVRQGVPALYLSAGNTEGEAAEHERDFRRNHYHRPSDDLSLPIDWDSAVAFTRLLENLLGAVADETADPVWLKGDFFGRIYHGPMQE